MNVGINTKKVSGNYTRFRGIETEVEVADTGERSFERLRIFGGLRDKLLSTLKEGHFTSAVDKQGHTIARNVSGFDIRYFVSRDKQKLVYTVTRVSVHSDNWLGQVVNKVIGWFDRIRGAFGI